MSMCVRYAGNSYRYLLDSVTVDHGVGSTSPMTRYYTAPGTPPGTWLGTGLTGLAEGAGVHVGAFVTPRQMERLFRDATDPVTDQPLGRSPHVYPTGTGRDHRRPVAGFDFTCTVPKSVSVLWALADPATREALYECHREALTDVLALIERDVARTRTGTNGAAQVQTRGVVAAAFDHWDSRANDPNLHTHLVIANRVQGPDGRWRTLDSRAIHRATVAMSERYDNLLADRITDRLGLAWEYRERGPQRNPGYELAAVPPKLTAHFARRSAAIEAESDRLIDAYVAAHGRRPDPATVLHLRQQATLATRDTKQIHSLADLTTSWRAQATDLLHADPATWAQQLFVDGRSLRGHDNPTPTAALIDQAATSVLAALSRGRTTWTPWNADAEASRALRATRFASPTARDEATASVVVEVGRRAVLLSAPEVASTPDTLRRSDGASVFRPHRGELYTSRHVLEAETRLLAASRDRTAPTLDPSGPDSVATNVDLFADQTSAIAAVATSGRVVDLLVGPAGSGKTRALAALRTAWDSRHGPNSVAGFAPSAAAADILGDALGITSETTAKWLAEHDREPDRLRRLNRAQAALHLAPDQATAQVLTASIDRLTASIDRWRLRPGQLVIVDEASLAGTLSLDRLAACAGEAGAKLLLVGDWAQLSSIEAGGAFGLLVRDRGADAPELGGVRRFSQAWERQASARLRVGDVASLDAYADHSRLQEGNHAAMVEAAYAAWAADERAGRRSLLLAGDLDTVRTLNQRARDDLVADGRIEADGTPLRDGLVAGVGDRVVTRRNDRRLNTGRGWVKNGDQWMVTAHHGDGSVDVRRVGGSTKITLPAAYVASHVELAYATTAYRAQGATVDTAHAVITGRGMTREVAYVMLTRARDSNRAYVCTDRAVEALDGFQDEPITGRSVLSAVLRNPGAELSAHETIEFVQEMAASIRTLAAEYETLAQHAQAARWTDQLQLSGLRADQVEAVTASPAYSALTVALRRAEAHGLDVDAALPRLVEGAAAGAQDVAAVLHGRVERWATARIDSTVNRQPCASVAGLIPAPMGVADPDVARALSERAALIEHRADALVDRAERAGASWLQQLGAPPQELGQHKAWRVVVRTVAAFRELHDISDPERPLGKAGTGSLRQTADRARVVEAITAVHESNRPDDVQFARPAPTAVPACRTPLGW